MCTALKDRMIAQIGGASPSLQKLNGSVKDVLFGAISPRRPATPVMRVPVVEAFRQQVMRSKPPQIAAQVAPVGGL